jgi:hypothetical protein
MPPWWGKIQHIKEHTYISANPIFTPRLGGKAMMVPLWEFVQMMLGILKRDRPGGEAMPEPQTHSGRYDREPVDEMTLWLDEDLAIVLVSYKDGWPLANLLPNDLMNLIDMSTGGPLTAKLNDLGISG